MQVPIEIFKIFNEWIVILHWLQLFFGCFIGQDDGLWILGKKKKTIGFGEGGWPEACLNSVTSQSVPGHSSQPKAALLRRLLEWEKDLSAHSPLAISLSRLGTLDEMGSIFFMSSLTSGGQCLTRVLSKQFFYGW